MCYLKTEVIRKLMMLMVTIGARARVNVEIAGQISDKSQNRGGLRYVYKFHRFRDRF